MDVVTIYTEAQMQAYLEAHGRTARPASPYAVLFPALLVTHAIHHLQASGHKRLEQLVLWGGYTTPHGVVLASLLLPETEANWGWVHILPEEQPKITEWLHNHGQLLFVEAHARLWSTSYRTFGRRSPPSGWAPGWFSHSHRTWLCQ